MAKTKQKTIHFDDLMDMVRVEEAAPRKKYFLRFGAQGRAHRFEGTEEIVPFVENKLGIKVIGK